MTSKAMKLNEVNVSELLHYANIS